MKKILCFLVVSAVSSLSFAKINEKLFKENIIKSEPCEVQNVTITENSYKYQGEITFEQFKEDIANLKYILETCYAGYEDACARGMNLDEVFQKIEKKFEGQEKVYTRDFAKAFYEEKKNI